jgi:hypothetical protein
VTIATTLGSFITFLRQAGAGSSRLPPSTFKSRSIRPYLEGGLSYNHLTNIYGYWNPSHFDTAVPSDIFGSRFEPTHNTVNRRGVVVGAGAEIKQHLIHLTPGFGLRVIPLILRHGRVPRPHPARTPSIFWLGSGFDSSSRNRFFS